MKQIRWLASLAAEKPILFGVVLLLIGITTLFSVVKYEEEKYSECEDEKGLLIVRYEAKIDSLTALHRAEIKSSNQELKETLNRIISGYRTQIDEQRKLNRSFRKLKNEIQE